MNTKSDGFSAVDAAWRGSETVDRNDDQAPDVVTALVFEAGDVRNSD